MRSLRKPTTYPAGSRTESARLTARHAVSRAPALAVLSLGLLSLAPEAASQDNVARDYAFETIEDRDREGIESDARSLSVDTEAAQTGQADTAELLRTLPAVRVRQTGGPNAPAWVSVRGSEPEAVNFALNGIPLSGGAHMRIDANMLLPEVLDTVTVYSTSTPIDLGPALPGGTVNLQLIERSGTGGAALAGYGSFGTRKLVGGAWREVDDGNIIVTANYRGSRGNYHFYDTNGTDATRQDDTPSQRRHNNDFNQGSLLLARSWSEGRHRMTFFSLTDIREEGVSGLDVAQAESARRSRLQQVFGFSGSLKRAFGPNVDLDWQAAVTASRARYDDSENEVGFGYQDRSDGTVTGYVSASLGWWLPRNVTVRTFVSARGEHYRPTDTLSSTPVVSASRLTPQGAASLRWRSASRVVDITGSMSVSANLDRRSPPDDGRDDATTTLNLTPQLGMVLKPLSGTERLQLYGYAARTHRAPGFQELFGDNGADIGNTELRPESQTQVEVGASTELDWDKAGFRASATLWRQWRQDAIEYVVRSGGVRKPFNFSGADARGADLRVDVSSQFVAGGGGISLLQTSLRSADDQTDGKQLPWRSPVSAHAELTGRYDAFSATVSGRYDSGFYADDRNVRRYPAHVQLDLSAGFDAPLAAIPDIRIELRNVLDRRVATIPARDGGTDIRWRRPVSDYAGFPRPGRSIYVTLAWGFGEEGVL